MYPCLCVCMCATICSLCNSIPQATMLIYWHFMKRIQIHRHNTAAASAVYANCQNCGQLSSTQAQKISVHYTQYTQTHVNANNIGEFSSQWHLFVCGDFHVRGQSAAHINVCVWFNVLVRPSLSDMNGRFLFSLRAHVANLLCSILATVRRHTQNDAEPLTMLVCLEFNLQWLFDIHEQFIKLLVLIGDIIEPEIELLWLARNRFFVCHLNIV